MEMSERSYGEFSYTRHQTSSNVIILYNHSTGIKTKTLTLVWHFKLNYRLYCNFMFFH